MKSFFSPSYPPITLSSRRVLPIFKMGKKKRGKKSAESSWQEEPADAAQALIKETETKTSQPQSTVSLSSTLPPRPKKLAASKPAPQPALKLTPKATPKSAGPTPNKAAKQNSSKIPTPSVQYLITSSSEPAVLHSQKPLLLVLDLNGTLLHRFSSKMSHKFAARPGLHDFFEYAFATSTMMIWSSATPKNVAQMCQQLFTARTRQLIVAEWGRDTLGLTPDEYKSHTQVYKNLNRVWANQSIQASHPMCMMGGRWDQTNTVLIDDSKLKAAGQPHNLVEVPDFDSREVRSEEGKDVLHSVMEYLEILRRQEDVSSYIRCHPFKVSANTTEDDPTSLPPTSLRHISERTSFFPTDLLEYYTAAEASNDKLLMDPRANSFTPMRSLAGSHIPSLLMNEFNTYWAYNPRIPRSYSANKISDKEYCDDGSLGFTPANAQSLFHTTATRRHFSQ
ncbi:MAG: hypothetical protein M1829_001752 [Trizodia sp. TS-e1964]|nr:MAG: hypothetical protein M1829_001752 [Trizodia sp. TS-e1964]